MAVPNYTVRASVVDISSDTPLPSDKFVIDTNVWYWLTYPRASLGRTLPMRYQLNTYPQYIKDALNTNAHLYKYDLVFAELCHLIEKTEHQIYLANTTGPNINKKEFRHYSSAVYDPVFAEIDAAWLQVRSMAKTLSLTVNTRSTDCALRTLQQYPLDAYDLLMTNALKRRCNPSIITDDGDFVTIPDITVFTANRGAIQAATTAGKLIQR